MFSRILLLFLLLCSINGLAQPDYSPYGTLRVSEKLIADQTEILVGEWLGYIVSVCDSNNTRFLRVPRRLSDSDKIYLRGFRYPDSLLPEDAILQTLQWRVLLDTTHGYRPHQAHGSNSHQTLPVNSDFLYSKEKRKQLKHLLNLPVTGISFAQAEAFCRWRTLMDSLQNVPWWPHYTFRLPTVAEFNAMNQECDSTVRKTRANAVFIGRRGGTAGFNYRNVPMELVSKYENQNDLQEPWEFDSDFFSLYAIQGNVAEMTSREGAAFGGSYFHYAIESYRYKVQVYLHPERWLGFRCVAEIR